MKIKLLLLFVIMGNVLFAQQTFLIYRFTGKVQLKTGKKNEALMIGQLLNSNSIVRLDKGASLVLICEGYNSFTMNKSGTHSLAGYLDSCKNESRSLSANYFKYVWAELTNPATTPVNNRRKYMQNTGAVERGCPGITIEPLYDTVNNSTGDALIKWKTSMTGDQLTFVLFDAKNNGRLLFSKPAIQNFIHLDTLKKYKKDNREVYWNITINGNEMCSRKYIKYWKSADYAAYTKALNKSLKTILNEAERYYATGFVLEANHFIAEAIANYKKAATLNPTELKYQQPLNDLLQNK